MLVMEDWPLATERWLEPLERTVGTVPSARGSAGTTGSLCPTGASLGLFSVTSAGAGERLAVSGASAGAPSEPGDFGWDSLFGSSAIVIGYRLCFCLTNCYAHD